MKGWMSAGLLIGSSLVTATAEASSVTAMSGILTALQGEAQAWLFGGAVVLFIVGLLAHRASSTNSQFQEVFGSAIEWGGRVAFGAAALAFLGLIGIAAGEPISDEAVDVGAVVVGLVIEMGLGALYLAFLYRGVHVVRDRFIRPRA